MDFLSNDLDKYITEEKVKKKNYKCEHGKSRCKECGKGYCIHGKDKRWCKEGCGGSQICCHLIGKRKCRVCKGEDICKHSKDKYSCKECNPNKKYIPKKCEHNKWRNSCEICGKCEHDKRKDRCKICSPNAFCVHDKRKDHCKICSPNIKKYVSKKCEHGKWKQLCEICGNCEHGTIKRFCKICRPNAFCVHDKRKDHCKICNPNIKKYVSKKCEHGKWKSLCKKCGGNRVCKSPWCETIVKKKYEGYCLHCFMHLFPDKKVARNYKTKEQDVVDRVKETYPDFDWVHDKKIQDGCSKRRPDLLLDLGSHIIIIEIDEDKHSGYDSSCENKRLMELSQDVHHRPIVFIRFNPDKYVDSEGNTIKSCWRLNKQGIMTIMKTKEEEWKQRVDKLKETIQHWIDNMSDKTIEIVELYY